MVLSGRDAESSNQMTDWRRVEIEG